jgi:hypothetical protein
MGNENQLAATRLRESRDRVIAGLSDHFAHDRLDLGEFERRVTRAQISESPAEIQALLADLPATADGSSPAVASWPLVPAGQVRQQQTMLSIMGGTNRRGVWTVPRRLRIFAMMSGTHLDFREARFPPGPVDVEIYAVMSGTHIIVPPGLAVETHGVAIMGGFEEVNRTSAHPDPDAPLLRVHGFVMMGGVEIRMQLPGETRHEAKRRHRRDERAQRRTNRRA